MKRDFLLKLLPDVEKDVIDKIMAENGADIEKAKGSLDNTSKELEKAKSTITDYEAKIKTLEENGKDTKALQDTIAELRKEAEDRKRADDEAKARKVLEERFNAVVGESKFLNDYTRKGIEKEFREALGEESNKTKSDAEIYKSITEGKEGIFENPNKVSEIPPTGKVKEDLVDENEVRRIMGLPLKEK